MKLGKFNWLKDSFAPFVFIFLLSIAGVISSQRRINKNSDEFINIEVKKAVSEQDTSDTDTAEISEDVASDIIQAQFIHDSEASVYRNLNIEDARKINSEFERLHRTQEPNLINTNNYFASLLNLHEDEKATVLRDEILQLLTQTNNLADKRSLSISFNNLAYSYEIDGNRALAKEYYGKALAAKNNWFSFFGLASLAIKNNSIPEAFKHLRRALEGVDEEEKHLLYFAFAEKLYDEGHYQEAYNTHAIVLDLNSEYWPSRLGQAVSLKCLKRYEESEKLYNGLLLAQPNYAKAHFYYGLLLRKLGRPNDAIKEFNSTLLIDESHQRARRVLADTYYDTKNYEKAYSQYKVLHRRNLREPRYLYWMGCIDLIIKRYEAAEKNFRKAIEQKGGDYPDAWIKLAELWKSTDREAEALKSLEDLLRLHPDHAAANYELAVMLKDEGDKIRSLALIKNAVNLKPGSQIYRRKLATLLEDEGDLAGALKELKAAEKYDDENINTLTRLGELLGRMKKYQVANEYFKRVLALNSRKSVVWYNFGLNQARIGDCPSAIHSFSESIRNGDRQNNQYISKVLRQRAACYKKIKNLSAAKSDLTEALDLRENYSEARADLAVIFFGENAIDKSKQLIQEGLALDPNNCRLMKLSLNKTFGVTQNQWDERCGAEKENIEIKKVKNKNKRTGKK